MIGKLLILLLAAGVAAGLLAGCGGLPRSAVAEVNGKVITRNDLDRAMEELELQFGGQGLPEKGTDEYREVEKMQVEQLINMQIISFEAEEMGIMVSEAEINQQLDLIKDQFGGEEAFRSALESQNFTEDRLKDQIRTGLLQQRVFENITAEIEVTDEEVLEYYDQNQALFTKPETRKVRHILVGDEAAANQVIARLNAGEDFAAVAAEVSTDPGSKDQGGDLGEVATQNSGLVPEFEEAMGQLAAGQTSGPVQSSFGFHVIQVTEIIPAGIPQFEEAREDVETFLRQTRQSEVAEEWLEEARSRYDIVYAEGYGPEEPASTETAPPDDLIVPPENQGAEPLPEPAAPQQP
ncbi:MAG: peptidyl-prolyl cis-trans isomerase [Thermoleophilia bacterium]|nr:peptidyl-prolyl cis-trans isomerase [Thermoleophilia bacterium]